MSPQKKSLIFCLLFFCLTVFAPAPILCFEVIKLFSDSNLLLSEKLGYTFKYSEQQNDCKKIWIVYQIKSDPAVYYSKISIKRNNSLSKTLAELISDSSAREQYKINKTAIFLQSRENKNDLFLATTSNFETSQQKNQSQTTAIILDCSLESGRPRIYQVIFQSMDKIFAEEDRTIFWLGEVNTAESFDKLEALFFDTKSEKMQQQIIRTLSLHPQENMFSSFSKKVLKRSYPLSLKNEVVLCLGKKQSIQSLQLLIQLAFKAPIIELQKKAIQALAQRAEPTAHAAVRILARDGIDTEIRKEAMFWLSQIGDQESIQILNHILHREPQAEIQEYAVFAISQIPNDYSRILLSIIAQTNPSPRIREKAIFWLGQATEQKEINFVLDVLKGMEN